MKNFVNTGIINRDQYLSRIEPYINAGVIKVISGQRRVGKSCLLKQIASAIREKDPDALVVFINKEDYAFNQIKNDGQLMEYMTQFDLHPGNKHLFIDEVQEIENFQLAIRSLAFNTGWDICVSGSNAMMLSGELATLLSGRTVQIPVYSLSYNEFCRFHQLPDDNQTLLRYIRQGGMPHLIHLPDNDEVVREYLKNIFNTIVLKDIVGRFNIRNTRSLPDMIYFLADITGSLLSAKKISDYLKSQMVTISTRQVLEYLSYLEAVYLIHRVKRMEVQGRKIFEIGDKFFFQDVGMRHMLLPFQQKDIAKVLENLVYHHLLTRGFEVFVGKMGDKEIDFVAIRNGEKHYIQVAYLIHNDETHQREFGNLLAIPDNCPKTVVSMDETASGSYKGIEHVHIREFLKRED